MSAESRHPAIDVREWVDRARNDPQQYLERQATEVLLAAVASEPAYRDKLYLKGGILMGLVYNSPRQSAEIDLTAVFEPEDVESLRAALDHGLRRMPAVIGHPNLVCRIQGIEQKPSKNGFANYRFPALKVKIAYAERDTREHERLQMGRCSQLLEIDISYREPVHAIELVRIDPDSALEISAYSLVDLIAEKLRALLQQPIRRRYRRQDVYDISYLLRNNPPSLADKAQILDALRAKAEARDIIPTSDSLAEPEVRRRAREDWETLEIELELLPSFDEAYDEVETFYRSLPWDKDNSSTCTDRTP